MIEKVYPVEVKMLKKQLGEMRFGKLVKTTKRVLEEQLKIKLPEGAVGKRISETMTPYILDSGSIYPLEPLNEEIYPHNHKNPLGLTYINDELTPQPVLSTIAGSLAIDGSKEIWWIDGNNMYSANEVSEKSNLVGDRMLRRLAELFFSQLKDVELTRYQGDGFLISRESNYLTSLKQDIEKIQEQIKSDSALRNKLSAFFKTSDGIELNIGDFNLKKELPSLIVERDKKVIKKDLPKRINKLLEYHPEFKTLTEDLKSLTIEENSKIMEILEKSVFDHVVQPLAEKLSDKNFKILAYRDVHDMTEHFAGKEIDMLKIDIASMLKKINDSPGLGKDVGDEYLRVLFAKIVNSIRKENPGLNEIGILRRWGDFFIPMKKGQAELIKKQLEKIFNEECWYLTIDGNNKKPTLNFISKDDKKKHKSILSVMPIIEFKTNIHLEPTQNIKETTQFEARKNNDKIIGISMNDLDENVRHLRPKKTKERILDPRCTQIDWNHLAETMINPLDKKRGLPRLINVYKATPEEIDELNQVYEANLLTFHNYESMVWKKYKRIINQILNRTKN